MEALYNDLQKPKVAAYCRVSTDKNDQLMSLKAQQEFFQEYAQRNGFELVQLYTDEGISGTKLKNRKQFNRMMEDARRGLFEQVYVKDVSRLARNVVDFLQSIRQLKALGIDCKFVTANMSSNDGELTLTILAAVAQEESANLSKRVKFGKKKNAEHGRVPNLVFGYDKTPGEYFDLAVNEKEAEVIRRIFNLYTQGGFGANKIAQLLNQDGIQTKRGCRWSQNAICRILQNHLYTGVVVNCKERVEDFLTGKRVRTSPEERFVAEKPDLQIVSDEQFELAQQLLGKRIDTFKADKVRQSNKFPLSTLIRCEDCGRSFRRVCHKRQYGDYIKWACSTRNSEGKDACGNHTIVDEEELLEAIRKYLADQVSSPEKLLERTEAELRKKYRPDREEEGEEALLLQLSNLKKAKAKQTQMFEADIITLEELKERTLQLNQSISRCEAQLALLRDGQGVLNGLEQMVKKYCSSIRDVLSAEMIDNAMLKKVIDKITVSNDGTIRVHLKLFSQLKLD